MASSKVLDFKNLLEPRYDVVLESIPLFSRNIVIKELITASRTEADAAKLLHSLPTIITSDVSRQVAERHKKRFEEIVCKVSLHKSYFYTEKYLDFSIRKEGDASQIETVLNLSFQPQGISVNVNRKKHTFEVVLEADKVPVQKKSLLTIRKDIIRLGLKAQIIKPITVLGKQTGVESPIWEQKLDILYKEELNNTIAGLGCLSIFALPVIWFLGWILVGLFSSTPEPIINTASSTPSVSTGNSCPCQEGCVYVTDSKWATMNWTEQDEFKQQVRATTGKCTIVVGDPR